MKRAGDRLLINMARGTASELLDCAQRRIRWYEARQLTPPHLTTIAAKVLIEALQGDA